MRSKLLLIFLLVMTAIVCLPASMFAAEAHVVVRTQVGPRRVHRRYARRRVHHQYYVRHRTKWQHAKIIGGGAKTGASVGGLIGGPPGMAAGAAVGAGAGTAYDLKTRKVRVRRKKKTNA